MISLTQEAKGLDAGPVLLKKLESVVGKNSEEFKAMELILEEEKKHVEFGVKWFKILNDGEDIKKKFRDFCERYELSFKGMDQRVNKQARSEAGFDIEWLDL